MGKMDSGDDHERVLSCGIGTSRGSGSRIPAGEDGTQPTCDRRSGWGRNAMAVDRVSLNRARRKAMLGGSGDGAAIDSTSHRTTSVGC